MRSPLLARDAKRPCSTASFPREPRTYNDDGLGNLRLISAEPTREHIASSKRLNCCKQSISFAAILYSNTRGVLSKMS